MIGERHWHSAEDAGASLNSAAIYRVRRKRLRMFRAAILVFVLTTSMANEFPSVDKTTRNRHSKEPDQSQLAIECYGRLLDFGCPPGHRIRVLSDWFGIGDDSSVNTDDVTQSTRGRCRYEPGDCRVRNSIGSSVIHRYCEGKRVCNNFQVDRRICSGNQTKYEAVEYSCIPDAAVTNMCSAVHYQSPGGYLSTPNFPHMYPSNLSCVCELKPVNETDQVSIDFTYFLVKYDDPCSDWVETLVDGVRRRMCGYHRLKVRGSEVKVVFHSDARLGHQGVWSQFATDSGFVDVRCNPRTDEDAENSQNDVIKPEIASVNSLMTSPDYVITQEMNDDDDDDDLDYYVDGISPLPDDRSQQHANLATEDETDEQNEIRTPNSISTNLQKAAPSELSGDHNSSVGVLVISLCVGGVLFLFISFMTIFSLVKRRNSHHRPTDPVAKDHTQQQLNSLSFYDSIQLYGSLDRKTTTPEANSGTDPGTEITYHRDTSGHRSSCTASTGSGTEPVAASRERLCRRSESSLDPGPEEELFWVTVRTPDLTEESEMRTLDGGREQVMASSDGWTTVDLGNASPTTLSSGDCNEVASTFAKESEVYTHV